MVGRYKNLGQVQKGRRRFAALVSHRVIHSLLHLPHAQRLTFTRLIDLARAWAARGSAVDVIFVAGFEQLTPGALDTWLAARTDAGDALVARAWDASIRVERARMRDEAFAVQNELRREPRISSDAIGAVAQFFAPPGTTQAALQRQRQIYLASIDVARLQAQADAPGMSADRARDLQDQADLARGRLHGYRDMPVARAGGSSSSSSSALHPMPMYTPPDGGWPAFGNAQEVPDDDDDQPYTGPEEEEEREQKAEEGDGEPASGRASSLDASAPMDDDNSGSSSSSREEEEEEEHSSRATKKQRTSGRPVRPW